MSGLRAPEFKPPDLSEIKPADQDLVIAMARESREAAYARQRHAEERAKGLRAETITLLALGLALAGFLFGRSHHGRASVFAQAFVLGAVVFLTLSAIEALEVHLRVGVIHPPKLSELSKDRAHFLTYVEALERDRQVVDWTAGKKLNRFLQAQAWFSRGLLCLIIAGVLTAVFVARADQRAASDEGEKSPTSHTSPK